MVEFLCESFKNVLKVLEIPKKSVKWFVFSKFMSQVTVLDPGRDRVR